MSTYQNLPRSSGECPRCGAEVSRTGGQLWSHLRVCAGRCWAGCVRDPALPCASTTASSGCDGCGGCGESCVARAVSAARNRVRRGVRVLTAVLGAVPAGCGGGGGCGGCGSSGAQVRTRQKLQQQRQRRKLRRAEILAEMARRREALAAAADEAKRREERRRRRVDGAAAAAGNRSCPDVLECFERAKGFKTSGEVTGFCVEMLGCGGLPEDRVVSEPLTLPLPDDPATWVGTLPGTPKGVVFL